MKKTIIFTLLGFAIGLAVWGYIVIQRTLWIRSWHRAASPMSGCMANISGLGKSMLIYGHENDGKYPTVSKWCDLLVEHGDAYGKTFVCKGARKKGEEGRCHYAINPNCEPNSPKDVVLLFETKGGWNQFGGAELLTTENHKGDGCNILFNDGRVEFIRPEEIGQLNWGERQGNR